MENVKLVSVSLNLEDMVNKIMGKMKESGIKNVEWVCDRSGEWLCGVVDNFDGEDLKISIDLNVEIEEYID